MPEIIFVRNWQDNPVTKEIQDNNHCIMNMSDGVYYHNRLNMVIVVNSELMHPLHDGYFQA